VCGTGRLQESFLIWKIVFTCIYLGLIIARWDTKGVSNAVVIYGWDKNLETGIELLDAHHMQFLIAVNKRIISQRCKNDRGELERLIQFLQHYIQYHFQVEEAYQVECNYAGFREHQAQHDTLSTQLRFFQVRLVSCEDDTSLMEEFDAFLYDWVHEHILREDITFAQAYRHFQRTEAKRKVGS